ncbi:sugar transferase [Marivirga sp. S37H4]|uniref:Sugar transferase n=1 Tax=Marivirga aurantiaca TaxID=2802615 RepID=A0A934X163_9BACT|nr:sugar transferase [Marivirga aurantiaca]MBK6266505.1 sugar transferase [Marivirga aurantiaca]
MESVNYLINSDFEDVLVKRPAAFNKTLFSVSGEYYDPGLLHDFNTVQRFTPSSLVRRLKGLKSSEAPDAIIYFTNYLDEVFFEHLSLIGHTIRTLDLIIPIIIVSDKVDAENKKKVLKHGADDCFPKEFNSERLNYWIDFLKLFKKLAKEDVEEHEENIPSKVSTTKRAFDILVSGILLICLCPLMLIIALIIKLESRGPVFYVSKRAGVGYKVFDFLKFRSMSAGADQELNNLSHLNQYNGKGENKEENGESPVFFKIKNDPRITRFGKFLRDSSLDELPQLINVLRGDMSIVGNRPLPLYEAQQLTKDQCAMRFMAAAGITGLWQVTKRGKTEMSESERIALDISYAKENSFMTDMKLLLKTFPALLQEEKV